MLYTASPIEHYVDRSAEHSVICLHEKGGRAMQGDRYASEKYGELRRQGDNHKAQEGVQSELHQIHSGHRRQRAQLGTNQGYN